MQYKMDVVKWFLDFDFLIKSVFVILNLSQIRQGFKEPFQSYFCESLLLT